MYSYWAGARVKSVIQYLEPIDDVWQQSNMGDFFDQSMIDSAVEYDGSKYLIPITQHFVVVFYNQSVFNDLNIKPPNDWEAFLDVCQQIKEAGINPIALGSKNKWPAQFWFDYLLLRTAGMPYRDQLMQGKASYLDPEVKHVFSMMSQMITQDYFNANPDRYDWHEEPMTAFASGESAMMLMGSWALGTFEQPPYNLKAGRDFDYFQFPVVNNEIPIVSLGPVDGLVLPKEAQYLAGGKAVLSFMASVKAQEAMSIGSGALSPNRQIDPSIYSDIQLKMVEDIEKNKGWAFNYDLATPPEIAAIGLNLFKEFYLFPQDYNYLLEEAQSRMNQAWSMIGRE